MRTFVRVLAVLVAVPAVASLALGTVLLDLRVTLLSPAFLERLLVRQRVYAQAPELVVELMFEEMAQPQTGEEGADSDAGPSEGLLVAAELEEKFGRQAFASFVEALIPPAWVREQVERNFGALFTWLDGDSVYPELRLALSDLPRRLEGEEGSEAVRRLLARLPPCPAGEPFFREGEFSPYCRPPDAELDQLMAEFVPQLRREMPGDVSFRETLGEGELDADTLEGLSAIQRVYRFFVLGTWAVWLVSLLLLGFALLLAARSLEQALRWAGWPCVTAGGLVLVGMGTIFVLAPFAVQRPISQLSTQGPTPLVLIELGGALLKGVVRGFAGVGLALAGGLMLLGLAAVIAAALLGRLRAA